MIWIKRKISYTEMNGIIMFGRRLVRLSGEALEDRQEIKRGPNVISIMFFMGIFPSHSDYEVPEEFPAEEDGHVWGPVAGYSLVNQFVGEPLPGPPVLPARNKYSTAGKMSK